MRGMRMMRESLVVAAGLMILGGATASAARAQTVTPCADPNNCAQVIVGTVPGAAGGTVSVPLTFKQGPATAAAGGIDKIAAIALTLNIGSSLTLADCTLNADGLPASVVPDTGISNFKVVVENASCAGGRTHCLCPDSGSGITPDAFVNIVIYGPNPLPTPGPSQIDIPVLPAGPQILLTIGLHIGGAGGTIPLHIFTESRDSSKPQFTAYLSVGDKTAVDQTCVPVSGQPPCSAAGSVSQVAITDGAVTLMGCLGDCSGDGEVTVDELLKMVNIATGASPLSLCPVGDGDNSGDITIDEIIKAVGYAINGCPM